MSEELDKERPTKKPKLELKDEKLAAPKFPNNLLPPPLPKEKKLPRLQRSNANLRESIRGVSTFQLTKMLGGSHPIPKKDAKKKSAAYPKKKAHSEITSLEKKADEANKKLKILSLPADEIRKQQLQQELINIYLDLDKLKNNAAYKKHEKKIDFVAKKIKEYAKSNNFVLPKTLKERQEEEDAVVTDTEQEQEKEQSPAEPAVQPIYP